MRILSIRLKNLNSLAGEWEIDLTDPAYGADGIFAITGPTGAGKSTLLDAICLALYGRTPRLPRIGKSGNEIMSRQSGECFAEVGFETATGRWRSHWSQHRARRKPGGELQPPRHEIADADSGRLLETSLRGVAERVEALTGMDFERFTRSMLLAQGGFAAFLQAAPDERSPLLEQITGTAIYSQISIHVHARCSDERRTLELLQAALPAMAPLSAEQEQALRETLAQQQAQEVQLDTEIKQHAQAIRWLEGMAQLQAELDSLAQARTALAQQAAAFAPDQARLDAAQRALELAARHTQLDTLREAQRNDTHARQTLQAELPRHAQALTEADVRRQQAQTELQQAQAALQAAQPLLRRARELDWLLAERHRALATLQADIAQQTHALHALQTQHQQDLAAQQAEQTALHALQEQLARAQADEHLVETLGALQARFDHLMQSQRERQRLRAQVAQAEQALHQNRAQTQARTATLHAHQQACTEQQQALASQQAAWQRLLHPHTLADWRHHLAALQAQQALLREASDALQAHHAAQTASQALAERQGHLVGQQQALAEHLHALETQHQARTVEHDLLETQLSLLQRIESLEAARHELRDGEPCPLCGALEHPFAHQHPIARPDQTRQRLTQLREELATVAQNLSDTRVQQARTAKDLEQIATEQARLAQAAGQARERLTHACTGLSAALPLDTGTSDDGTLSDRLEAAQQEHARQIAHASHTVAQAEAIEQAIAELRHRLEQAQAAQAQAERDTQAAQHRLQMATDHWQRLTQEAARQDEQSQHALAALTEELRPYGTTSLDTQTLGDALATLQARRDTWLARQRQRRAIEDRLIALEQRIAHQSAQIRLHTQTLAQQTQAREAQELAHRQLVSERQALLAGQDADAEETRLQTRITQAHDALELARAQHDAARQTQQRLQARLDELAQAIAECQTRLQAAETDFAAALPAHGFADEAAYRAAHLPEPERRRLAAQASQLAQAQAELAARQTEKTTLLANERAKALTDTPLDTLREHHASRVAGQRALLQTLGTLGARLRDNERSKAQQQAQLQAIAAQQQEYLRWQQLHDLIGSADGKKYRNFAQGLTFETMLGHANRQLQRMSDRYLLVHDAAQPLELHVIDGYQAGEVRSTRNLSGGESFIVSLALALGLSHMASQNVRVDSLFLDEGFGTLDEDALDTALDTLASLQQQGKLIGVISHMQALKDRIPTQIQVTPLAGGRSALTGPGCRAAAGGQGAR